ncbi:RNA polymerase sigma factor [Nocardioides marmotae]|nr:sigma-70 family RNA polymerase sigma factor [Nocardioides marmotae]QKE01515.1 sigma-70 family RNA polymerase sigma factor [Nocardioides marmotae]
MGARDRDVDDRVRALVDANTSPLLAFFLRRVEAPEDAADLLHNALLVVWRRRAATPSDEVEARMWMYGVARKVLLTHHRSLRRRSALHDKLRDELAGESRVETTHPMSLDVRDAISRLERLDQEIIRLTYWDGFTLAQAARHLRMSEGTVRSRHHRARHRLRALLSVPEPDTAR